MIRFLSYSGKNLTKLLDLQNPPLWMEASDWAVGEGASTARLQASPYPQLEELEAQLATLRCQSALVEERYVDRDHMEDHTAFYASALGTILNTCRRVHFFSMNAKDLEAEIDQLRKCAYEFGEEAFRRACKAFSEKRYLGFTVIRPLQGYPVGRTVLKFVPRSSGNRSLRHFDCMREYHAHVAGVRITVRGLAFQQQDVGVSACATTALWSAFHKMVDYEDIALPSPAKITSLAARYSLPHGRHMPSEGLSVDQMCQATRAIGLSPHLFNIGLLTPPRRLEFARAYIYSSCVSGYPCVLILKNLTHGHAVTVAGVSVRARHEPSIISEGYDDASGDLLRVYVQDDRLGPYVPAVFKGSSETLTIEGPTEDPWQVTHVLVPMHPKVRLSFSALRHIAQKMIKYVQHQLDLDKGELRKGKDPIVFETRIERSHHYIARALQTRRFTPKMVQQLSSQTVLSRYIGVITLRSNRLEPLEVLIDTTNTERNANFLAVIAPKVSTQETDTAVLVLTNTLRSCCVIGNLELATPAA
jgi:hypothetical protein